MWSTLMILPISSIMTEIILGIRCECNYHCSYCIGINNKESTLLFNLDNLRGMYDTIEGSTITSIECGASEPTLHPQIKDILKIAMEHGAVSIPTNNSLAPSKWIPNVVDVKMLVRAALHPTGEKNINDFLVRLCEMRALGAEANVVFVAHPKRLNKIQYYTGWFGDAGFKVDIQPYQGRYKDKVYPEGYTEEEKQMCGWVRSTYWYNRLIPDMTIRDFYSIPCIAGWKSVYIDYLGNINRCYYDATKLRKPITYPARCGVHCCGCGLLLEELNTLNEVSYQNYWRGIAHLPLLGGEQVDVRTPDEVYQQNKAKYWELMKRYGRSE
jgi:MoaA/NifB/PqqE/SkfB family radical SAM enzyme